MVHFQAFFFTQAMSHSLYVFFFCFCFNGEIFGAMLNSIKLQYNTIQYNTIQNPLLKHDNGQSIVMLVGRVLSNTNYY